MTTRVQPAKQTRSLRTQERIVAATSELLVRERFESITVRRIVEESGTSVGSFYARFPDKEALLAELYRDYEAKLERSLARLALECKATDSLYATAELAARHFVAVFGDIPNLSRALYEYATRDSDSEEARALAERRFAQYAFLLEALLRFANDISHSDRERAVEMGLYFMVVACRNRLLYPEAPQSRTLRLAKKDLAPELARLLTGYLTL